MKNNFLITVIGGIILSILAVIYILMDVIPSDFYLGLLLLLFTIVFSLSFGLVYMLIRKPKGYLENQKVCFRRGAKIGLILSVLIVLFLVLQINFDFF